MWVIENEFLIYWQAFEIKPQGPFKLLHNLSYAAKIGPSYMFPSIDQLLDNLSKFCMTFFGGGPLGQKRLYRF